MKGTKLKYAIGFLGLFLLFVLIRFPYGEMEIWAISEAGKRAGIEIAMSDASLLLPLGVELEGISAASKQPGKEFRTPKLERLGLRVNALSLLSREKKGSFSIVSGGKGEGTVVYGGETLKIEVDAADISAAGAGIGKDILVEKGKVGIRGSLTAGADPMKGEGRLTLSGRDVLIRGLHPLLPEFAADRIDMEAEKKGDRLTIKSLGADLQGITLTGSGTITLKGEPMRSGLSLSVEVDASRGGEGVMAGLVSLLGAVGGGGDRFSLVITGTPAQPGVTVNGNKLL